MTPWRSGDAAVCKTAYTGSIPVGVSSSKAPTFELEHYHWNISLLQLRDRSESVVLINLFELILKTIQVCVVQANIARICIQSYRLEQVVEVVQTLLKFVVNRCGG